MQNPLRYVALALALIFCLFAFWQINDPDPILWVSVYLVSAYYSLQVYRGHINRELFLVLGLLALVAAVNSYLQMTSWEGMHLEQLSMKSQNQEIAREVGGLIVCGSSFIWHFFTSKKS
jgi:hypothetical protein